MAQVPFGLALPLFFRKKLSEMALNKAYQIVSAENNKVWKTRETEEDCLKYLGSKDLDDYMGRCTLYIRPIWTNMNQDKLNKLFRE